MFKLRALLLAVATAVLTAAPALALHQPDPPTVAAQTVEGAISLTWTEVRSTDFPIVKYRLSRLPAFSDGADRFTSSSDRSYIDAELVNGIRYTYSVRAIDLSGKEGLPGSGSATAGVPLAPQDFAVTTTNSGRAMFVDLSWAAPLANGGAVTEYRIYRAPEVDPIARVRADTLYYSDVIAAECSEYDYYVTAVNVWGESAHSKWGRVRANSCPWG